MSDSGAVVVVGGTRAIGLEIARLYASRGSEVVLTGRTPANVAAAVAELAGSGGQVRGVTFDLARPREIAPALADLGPVHRLVLVAIDRDANSVADYDIDGAIRLVTLKLVGYTAVVSALRTRLDEDASIVLFGGIAMERPYPGSTTVTTVNGGVVGLTRTLMEELKPVRVNALHPGYVGDSPFWKDKAAVIASHTARSPLNRLATMADVADATAFLLENRAVNGTELWVDCGGHCR